ncbi:hypothetical protein A0J59_04450 [Cellulosimicrobium sp. I38E]|nr:hypothetical protein A0J59_04450 [Cellulosimicrobium sp. I38E]
MRDGRGAVRASARRSSVDMGHLRVGDVVPARTAVRGDTTTLGPACTAPNQGGSRAGPRAAPGPAVVPGTTRVPGGSTRDTHGRDEALAAATVDPYPSHRGGPS